STRSFVGLLRLRIQIADRRDCRVRALSLEPLRVLILFAATFEVCESSSSAAPVAPMNSVGIFCVLRSEVQPRKHAAEVRIDRPRSTTLNHEASPIISHRHIPPSYRTVISHRHIASSIAFRGEGREEVSVKDAAKKKGDRRVVLKLLLVLLAGSKEE